MRKIGAFEAKNRLSELLEQVENGEEFMITKHGKPVAQLVPTDDTRRTRALRAVEAIKQLRQKNPPMTAEAIVELIKSGRRY